MVSEQNTIESVGFQKNSFSNMGGDARERMEMRKAFRIKDDKRKKVIQDKLDVTNKADLNLGTDMKDVSQQTTMRTEDFQDENKNGTDDRDEPTRSSWADGLNKKLMYGGIGLSVIVASVLIYKKFKK